MAVRFRIWGNLRFLSHAETVSVFQRAFVRAGIKVQYSQGFNPRSRLSLPLPRSVGVESDDELLCVRVWGFDAEEFTARLSAELPEGCELAGVDAVKGKAAFRAKTATYVFRVRQREVNEELKGNIRGLLASERVELERRIDARGNVRNVEVRGFVKSVEFNDGEGIITVECNISPSGTIRVDEILQLLGLDVEDLTGPIKRTKVEWQNN